MPYFETSTDGTRLHYVDYGPREGRTVVFVNSSYFGTEMWEFQMLPLAAEGYRCVGLDRRGHGRSDDVWGGFDLDTLAGDVGALLDHLDLTDITLVGHSVGTAEVVRYLTLHGSGRVARVALVAGMVPGPARSADYPEGVDPALIEAGNEVFRKDRPAFFANGAAGFFALDRPGNDISPAHVQYWEHRCTGATARAANALGELIVTLNLAPELTKIDVPVLVVHGTHDVSAPIALTGERAARLIPDSTYHVYENAGHGLFVTHADRLTADLREFTSGR
ncbi:alpha/beta hydrolase [Streptomyces melanogenes]|uniref:Alpha/beta hydrolase n=1 Tax=Streptomyces melanogenes TaxID=67326 RepID=A0ABZ1XFX0_9ACTN|nr:alpha/beta hydrolase [Streptomyces melanogenes]